VTTEGIVNIHGKQYMTVAYRVNKFREDCPDWTIETQLIMQDDEKVIMKALIMANEVLLATGYAEEVRGSSSINMTSALEVCETSAIGRALAALGYAGTEYASADEVAVAISQQKVQEATDGLIKHLDAVRDEWASIHAIKTFLSEETPNVDAAREAFKELDESIQHVLWRAPTKGGVFTTLERKLLKEGTA
jgi:hypothetical protein